MITSRHMMRLSNNAATLLLSTATVSAYAAPSSSRSFFTKSVSKNLVRHTTPITNLSSKLNPTRSTKTKLGMANIFSNFFGGGAYNSNIDYASLDHPGPELAESALQKKVIVHGERDPRLLAATFAGGCFWGLELAYQRVPGVVHTASGYTQGPEESPSYSQVCSGGTGHTEAVIVYYDPKECSYEKLLDTFFERVNPTTRNGQGNDYGTQYRTGVYFHSKEQEEIARKRFDAVKDNYTKAIASELKAATPFWPAEKHHQQYLEKGGRGGKGQDASKGATENIRCYG